MRRLSIAGWPPSLACGWLVVAAFAVWAPAASAEPAVGIVNGANILVTFDTTAPGTFTSAKQITGLASGERLVDVDFRHNPATSPLPVPPPRLFGLGVIDGGVDTVRPYTIDAGTGVATQIGTSPFVVTNGNAYGIDFNPTVDRFRVVNDGNENFRINPNNGARADAPTNDTDLNPAGNQISGIAYDRVSIPTPPAIAANTTLHAISLTNSSLVTIGGINQSPSPNGGAIQNSLSLGLTLAAGTPTGFDIDLVGTAFATLTSNATGLTGLYTINLSTGAATLVGQLPAKLSGFAIVPATTAEFVASSLSQPESGTAVVTVQRSGSLAHTTSVAYATSDGTATTGDYGAAGGTLTFAPGETAKTFSVSIVADGIDEPDETIGLTLSSPSFPMSLGTPSIATLTIVGATAQIAQPKPLKCKKGFRKKKSQGKIKCVKKHKKKHKHHRAHGRFQGSSLSS